MDKDLELLEIKYFCIIQTKIKGNSPDINSLSLKPGFTKHSCITAKLRKSLTHDNDNDKALTILSAFQLLGA